MTPTCYLTHTEEAVKHHHPTFTGVLEELDQHSCQLLARARVPDLTSMVDYPFAATLKEQTHNYFYDQHLCLSNADTFVKMISWQKKLICRFSAL